jgi:RimJ/RimL family protein N-acetyltransferase
LIHADNRASLRVAEKLGFRALRRRDYRDYPAILFDRGLD